MTLLKWVLPLTLATLIAHADELNFTKNIPPDYKTKLSEASLPTYDNRFGFTSNLNHFGGGLFYERIKPESAYIHVGTFGARDTLALAALGGYNFQLSPQDILRPSGGLIFKKRSISPILAIEYEHSFNPLFSMGATLVSELNDNFTVGIPCKFHVGSERRWEHTLTPQFGHAQILFFSINQTSISYSVGYRF